MKVIKVDPNKPEPKLINQIVAILQRGGTFIYPTDTCYGLGGDARNPRVTTKIAKLKNRPADKKFSVVVKDILMAKEVGYINEKQEQILKRYLPGPFTFLVPNADYEILKSNSIGLRIPDYPITQAIANSLNEPFITTSANISGGENPYSCFMLDQGILNSKQDSQDLPDIIIDAGELPNVPASTIVDLTTEPYKIIRQGGGEFKS
ncbi:threonylcarbamoyl-AMP synthase [Candidatus Berkelbacteria bacterium]|nr:threonylcarbamoyl-AMP synthase [Candidatus Berkelbacteria bacterium]